MFWSPTLAVQADPADFVLKLAESVKGYKCPDEWLQTLREKDSQKEEANK